LSLLVEVLAGILSGAGCANPTPGPEEMNGLFLLALDPAAFLPPDQFRSQVDQFVDYVKSARPAPGSPPVHIPGDASRETAAKREREGVPLNQATVDRLSTVLRDLKLSSDLLPA
jgi:LDH2 family malate/lactate/ureidoglycolate dehydrogenase